MHYEEVVPSLRIMRRWCLPYALCFINVYYTTEIMSGVITLYFITLLHATHFAVHRDCLSCNTVC
jgi:hypothetical protein